MNNDDDDVRRIATVIGAYRFVLTQTWSAQDKRRPDRVAFVMLNPSTADAEKDDPTLRRCRGFAKEFGHDGLEVVNLYAYRATNPYWLTTIGPLERRGSQNDAYIKLVTSRCSRVIVAWGRRPPGLERVAHEARVLEVCNMIRRNGSKELYCLGLTKQNEPRHPLMLPKTSHFFPYTADLT